MGPDAAPELHFAIGGLTYSLHSLDPDLLLRASGASERFLIDRPSAGADGVLLEASLADDLERAEPGELVFDSGGVWRLYRRGEEFWFRFESPALGSGPYKTATFDSDFKRGHIELRRDRFAGKPVNPLDYPLDELLSMQLLGAGRGVEIHGCGMVDEAGRGMLFAAHSGGGKSTTARLWSGEAGVRVLSDDRLILRREGDGVRMYGTPWHGEAGLALAESAPLKAIFLLGKGPEARFRPAARPDAVAKLLTMAFVPYYNAGALDFTLGLLDEITQRVPCESFEFAPDERTVPAVRRWMEGRG